MNNFHLRKENILEIASVTLLGVALAVLTFGCSSVDLGTHLKSKRNIAEESYESYFKKYKISKGDINVEILGGSNRTPWSGSWFPFRKNKMVEGKFSENSSPFEKYAKFVEKKYGITAEYNPWDAVSWENIHHTYNVKELTKNNVPSVVTIFDWHGHCDGLAAAAILEKEPINSVIKEGIEFTPADIKALLTEFYLNTQGDSAGVGTKAQKNKEKTTVQDDAYFASHQPLFTADEFLNSGKNIKELCENLSQSKILNEYLTLEDNTVSRINEFVDTLDLYERVKNKFPNHSFSKKVSELLVETSQYRKTVNKIVFLNSTQMYKVRLLNRSLLSELYPMLVPQLPNNIDSNKLTPYQFYTFLRFYIEQNSTPIAMDFNSDEKVHNHPVFDFKTLITPSKNKNEYNVKTDILYSHYAPFINSENFIGTKIAYKTYKYKFFTNDKNVVIDSKWENSDHPDYLWIPFSHGEDIVLANYDFVSSDFNVDSKLADLAIADLEKKLKAFNFSDSNNNLNGLAYINNLQSSQNFYKDVLSKVSNKINSTMQSLAKNIELTKNKAELTEVDIYKIKKLNRYLLVSFFNAPTVSNESNSNPFLKESFIKEILEGSTSGEKRSPPSNENGEPVVNKNNFNDKIFESGEGL